MRMTMENWTEKERIVAHVRSIPGPWFFSGNTFKVIPADATDEQILGEIYKTSAVRTLDRSREILFQKSVCVFCREWIYDRLIGKHNYSNEWSFIITPFLGCTNRLVHEESQRVLVSEATVRVGMERGFISNYASYGLPWDRYFFNRAHMVRLKTSLNLTCDFCRRGQDTTSDDIEALLHQYYITGLMDGGRVAICQECKPNLPVIDKVFARNVSLLVAARKRLRRGDLW